jgi:hypothetical protein
MGNEENKIYRMFVDDIEKFDGPEGEIIEKDLLDEDTRGFLNNTKVILSRTPQEGYANLRLQGTGRSTVTLDGKWYVKVLEEEEDEEAGTVFEGLRLGQRKGYMLRSMLQEDKDKLKKETMTTELEQRLKRKKEMLKELRKKKEEK